MTQRKLKIIIDFFAGDMVSKESDSSKTLYDKIYEAVISIPKGKVATYGQIAVMAGNRGYARIVGNALHKNPAPGVIPCHRVVNAKGRLAPSFAFGGASEQQRLLEAEGVEVTDGFVSLEKYQMR